MLFLLGAKIFILIPTCVLRKSAPTQEPQHRNCSQLYLGTFSCRPTKWTPSCCRTPPGRRPLRTSSRRALSTDRQTSVLYKWLYLHIYCILCASVRIHRRQDEFYAPASPQWVAGKQKKSSDTYVLEINQKWLGYEFLVFTEETLLNWCEISIFFSL